MIPSPVLLEALAPLFVSIGALAFLGAVLAAMRPRRFYFVRHGETLLNAQHIKQGAEGSLSDRGKEQAAKVAEALAPLAIRRILSSPYERAKETSEILQGRMRARIVYSPLLAERRNPSDVIGKSTKDPLVQKIVDEMDLAYHEDDFRHADEENFTDLKKRAKKCLRWLIWRGSVNNCVVTHHAFLKMLLAYMLYREQLHAADFVKLSYFNTSDNAGISICEFHPWKFLSKTHGWEVVSYNQQA